MSETSNNTNKLSVANANRSDSLKKFFITFFWFCFLSFLGYYLYNKEDVYANNFTKGKVINSICRRKFNNWECNLNLSYIIDNNEYTQQINTKSFKYYYPRELIDLRYSKYDNKNITLDTLTINLKLAIVIFFGFISLIMSFIFIYSVFTGKNTIFSPSAFST